MIFKIETDIQNTHEKIVPHFITIKFLLKSPNKLYGLLKAKAKQKQK